MYEDRIVLKEKEYLGQVQRVSQAGFYINAPGLV